MAYNGIGFINDNPPAINASNLNKMDNELVYLDKNVGKTDGDIGFVDDKVDALGNGLITEQQTEITQIVRHEGYRYGIDGSLVAYTPYTGTGEADEISVSYGQKIRWVCYCANQNATTNVKYHYPDGTIVADTNYTSSGTNEYTFEIPYGCDKILVSAWVTTSHGNHFYNISDSIKSAKTYTDEEIADLKSYADAEIADVYEYVDDSIEEIKNAAFQTKIKSGNLILIDDSVLEKAKSISTSANIIYRSGINLWDEQWELGNYSSSGAPRYSTTNIRSKNTSPIPVQPETDYWIKCPYNAGICFYDSTDTFIEMKVAYNAKVTSPANAYYMRFYLVSQYGTTYNNDIQFTFDSDSEKQTYHAHNNQKVSNLDDLVLIPNAVNYIYAIGQTKSISITYYYRDVSAYIPKKPYQSGFIIFQVPSRLTKSNNSVAANAVSEGEDDSVNVNCILKLPTSYTQNGDPTKLIMICHGAGQSAEQWTTNASYQALTTAFVDAGYAIFDCNGYRENALGYSFWGDPRGVDVWRKAYQYVVDNYNVEHEFGIYGFSMGGLTALNLAFSRFPNIKCIALGSPVVNLEDVFNSSDGNKAVINLLYNMGETYDPAKAYGCNPFSRIMTFDEKDYIIGSFPPIKMWYGSTEDGTSTDPGTGEIMYGVVSKFTGHQVITAINNAGGQAEYREVEGEDHKICYGGNATVNRDYVLFFNRHNKFEVDA